MNKFCNYADYEIPLLQVLNGLPGGQGTTREVKDRFGEIFHDHISDEQRVYLESTREAKWRNMVAWTRNTLTKRDLMDSPAYGIWRITDAGRAYLIQDSVSTQPVVGPTLTAQPPQSADKGIEAHATSASTLTETDQTKELTETAFMQAVREVLEPMLSEMALTPSIELHPDGSLQVRFSDLADCYYQLRLSVRSTEFALCVSLPPKLNDACMKTLLSRQDELSDIFEGRVTFEKKRSRFARIFQKEARSPLRALRARLYALRLDLFILKTRPILIAVLDRGDGLDSKTRVKENSQIYARVDARFNEVQDFLNGRAGRPSDERLCDWVHLCYEFELYCEGRDLFALVDPTQVNSWYYERAKRLAKVCAMKVAGHA